MPSGVRPDIQIAVDQYLDFYVEMKALEKKVDALRKVIQPYMEEVGFDEIYSSNGGGKVELARAERSSSTSKYTTYDAERIASLLSPGMKKKCFVEVVDKDKLEALCKLGEIPENVLEERMTKVTTSFLAKLKK